MQTAKQNDNEHRIRATKLWSWKRNSTSIVTWPVDVASKSHTLSASPNARLRFGSRIDAWNGRRSTKWPQWLYRITWPITVIHINSIFIRHSSRTWAHRTRGTFRVLVRDSISCTNKINTKDTRIMRMVRVVAQATQRRPPYSTILILRSIRKSFDFN